MDILSHTLTGVAVSTAIIPFCKSGIKGKAGIVGLGGFGGLLPDFDVISLWSKFDGTIGRLFNLQLSGKEIYFSKLWYSHHGFLHSIFAAILLAIIIGFVMFFITKKQGIDSFLHSRTIRLTLLAFFLGFFFHLLEDMPTPASVWGGVRLWFPSMVYLGGSGKIWWWNNYDIFLIIVTVITINIIIFSFPVIRRKINPFIPTLIFLAGFTFALAQINSRSVDFSYSGHTKNYYDFEIKSKQIQREILGEKLYTLMVKIDNRIPLNF